MDVGTSPKSTIPNSPSSNKDDNEKDQYMQATSSSKKMMIQTMYPSIKGSPSNSFSNNASYKSFAASGSPNRHKVGERYKRNKNGGFKNKLLQIVQSFEENYQN